MYQKLRKKVYYTLKQELLIMQGKLLIIVQKYGKINHMIKNQIYGHWVVFFTNFVLLNLLLELKIWKVCTKK